MQRWACRWNLRHHPTVGVFYSICYKSCPFVVCLLHFSFWDSSCDRLPCGNSRKRKTPDGETQSSTSETQFRLHGWKKRFETCFCFPLYITLLLLVNWEILFHLWVWLVLPLGRRLFSVVMVFSTCTGAVKHSDADSEADIQSPTINSSPTKFTSMNAYSFAFNLVWFGLK